MTFKAQIWRKKRARVIQYDTMIYELESEKSAVTRWLNSPVLESNGQWAYDLENVIHFSAISFNAGLNLSVIIHWIIYNLERVHTRYLNSSILLWTRGRVRCSQGKWTTMVWTIVMERHFSVAQLNKFSNETFTNLIQFHMWHAKRGSFCQVALTYFFDDTGSWSMIVSSYVMQE